MLKYTWEIIIMWAVFLMISGCALTGDLKPPGGPAPTMNTLKEIYDKVAIGTEISSCPYEIDSPGFYYITRNLYCPSGSHGITISADDVTLDLMGFIIMGSRHLLPSADYHGIFMTGRSNVEIRNGSVIAFTGHGIHEDSFDARGHRIINVRARNNGKIGIHLSSKGNLVKGCTTSSNSHNS